MAKGARKGASFERALLRFWPKTIVMSGRNACWEWIGATSDKGYGVFWFEGHFIGAHVFSFLVHNGELPNGQRVLHKCDNPPCIRPSHIFAGTQKDNIADCIKKGRFRGNPGIYDLGEDCWNSKLTDEKVRLIRYLSKEGISFAELGRQFGVSAGTIKPAVEGKTWRHVT